MDLTSADLQVGTAERMYTAEPLMYVLSGERNGRSRRILANISTLP